MVLFSAVFHKKKEEISKNRGFTLIEMLVAASVFSIVVGAIVGIFGLGLKSQRYILSSGNVLDETSYALDYISRAIRMAKKDRASLCLSEESEGKNYENPNGEILKISFKTYDNECQQFALKDGKIKMAKVSEESGFLDDKNFFALTSDKLEITSLKFKILDEEDSQSRVTIFLEIEGKGSKDPKPKMKIQTTVSQRNLNL